MASEGTLRCPFQVHGVHTSVDLTSPHLPGKEQRGIAGGKGGREWKRVGGLTKTAEPQGVLGCGGGSLQGSPKGPQAVL